MVWRFIFNINGNFILYPTCNMVGVVFNRHILYSVFDKLDIIDSIH